MHRWFFANERESCSHPSDSDKLSGSRGSDEKEVVPPPIPTTDWPFCVTYHKPLVGNEYVGIIGNCEELGNWDPQRVCLMGHSDCECKVGCKCRRFELTIKIPRNIDVEYRYCIVAYDPILGDTIVRFWEVHMPPRVIRTCQNMLKPCDRFGYKSNDIDAEYLVDRGWASIESYVHFKIFNAPFIWLRQSPRLLYVHIQPMFEVKEDVIDDKENSSVTRTQRQFEESTRLAYTEVANLRTSDSLHFQPPFGVPCGCDDMQLYHCSIAHPADTLYRLDLYTFAYKSGVDEPPYHYGYGFIQPDALVNTEGYVRVCITCASTHRPLIEMCIRYLIIRPLAPFTCSMETSYQRYWRRSHPSLEIGHRGCGSTYRLNENIYRENTLFSLRRAQMYNADMVEVDVQLTKDAQVVVYHNHVLKFLLQSTPTLNDLLQRFDLMVFPYEELNRLKLLAMGGSKCCNFFALPFESFTYEQLCKAYALRFATIDKAVTSSADNQRPFPLLMDILNSDNDSLPSSLGLNIEVKWVQLDSTRRWQDNGFKPTFDRNIYVDTILDVVLRYAGKRRIILSSFDADICTMMRFKQNRYPVVLITEDPDRQIQFLDQRVSVIDNAFRMASALEFFGLALHTNSILYQPIAMQLLHEFHLRGLAWGSINVDESIRVTLRSYGIIGVIYDRIDQMDQAGEPLEGNLFTIDSVRTRAFLKKLRNDQWKTDDDPSVVSVKTDTEYTVSGCP